MAGSGPAMTKKIDHARGFGVGGRIWRGVIRTVIRGLDARIHLLRRILFEKMDGRVRPGYDEEKSITREV
jgi:hypothetical protein